MNGIELWNRFSFIFKSVMAFVYILLGVLLILDDEFISISKFFKIFFGIIFISYGVFRAYRFFRENSIRNEDFTALMICLFFSSCSDQPVDTPTTGEINISVDETFLPFVESEVNTFTSLYKYSKINVSYTSEAEAFVDLLKDSSRLIVVSRELNEVEKKHFEKIKIFPSTIKIANDALAIIVNKENPDNSFSLSQTAGIIKGNLKNWKDINGNSSLGEIQIVFDNKNSGTARFAKEIINEGLDLPVNSFALQKNSEVVDYVSKNKNSLGIIGVNWISDDDDSLTGIFLSKVTVIALEDSAKTGFYKPYQAYIAKKLYPFVREVFIISREARSGLGTGFSAFVAGEKGQRIILKSGLVPATMPVRILEFR